jgi:CDP-diacylglycerol--serine O-phosphatidyltransferase
MAKFKSIIPNSFTTGNLLGGILAIILIFSGRLDLAPWCIFASALFDFFDGFLARMLKVDGEMGKQLDSLADMITFGVAPGLLILALINISVFTETEFYTEQIRLSGVYQSVDFDHLSYVAHEFWGYEVFRAPFENQIQNLTPFQRMLPFTGLIFTVFALFRLAKFNIDTRQSDSFIGLPTPGGTLFFAVFPIILSGMDSTIFGIKGPTALILNPYFLIISTLVISILMVSELPLFALKFKNFKWKGNEIRFSFLAISLVLIITLFFWSVPVIILMYLALSIISHYLGGKKEEI